MTDISRFAGLEHDLNTVYSTPAARPQFVAALQGQLSEKAGRKPSFVLRPAWIATAVILLGLVISFFAIGPQRVAAAVQKLLGYVPGMGLISTDAPLRVLAEPVEQTRDGVTITVVNALLSADQTRIEYHVFGVPRSAYPDREDVVGCIEPEYLRLPDGTRLVRSGDLPAVPPSVNEAVLVIPCLADTLPGKAPENWELPLRFVAAPPQMTVYPVEEVTPTASATPGSAARAGTATPEVTQQPGVSVQVQRSIDTEDGYIIVVSFGQSGDTGGAWLQQTGAPYITDAAGNKVHYSIPLDVQNSLPPDNSGAYVMAYQFNAAGVTFPLTIHYQGVLLSVNHPEAQASITFDAGANPQPGQEWQINQQVELAGHKITLVSVTAGTRGSDAEYSFRIRTEEPGIGVNVSIEGYETIGGGGGGSGMAPTEYTNSLLYRSLPTGNLTVVLSNLVETSETMEWTGQWSPEVVRTDIPATPQLGEGVCANGATIDGLAAVPQSMQGKVMIHQIAADGSAALTLSNLDGSGQQVLTAEAGWETLSGNGQKAVYSSPQGFVLLDIASGVATPLNLSGYDPVLSYDGNRLAYVNNSADGVNIYDISTQTTRRISDRAYAATVGWSADNTAVYIADMAAGGSAWQIRKIDVNSGAVTDGILIENGSYKSLDIAMSPDEMWVAYRGRDNAGVYLASLADGQTRLLLDNLSLGTSGIAWGSNDWLGVSIMEDDNTHKVLLVNTSNCQVWLLPALGGSIEGLSVQE